MSHRWRIVVGLLALAFVAAAPFVGLWLLRSGDAATDKGEPPPRSDELGCLVGIYANTDFALDGDDGGDLTVCHYDKLPAEPSSGQSHRLDSSRVLSPEESEAVRAAVAAAPRGELPFEACPPGDDSAGEFFLVRTPTLVAFWVYNAECGDNGVVTAGANGGVVHRLVRAGP